MDNVHLSLIPLDEKQLELRIKKWFKEVLVEVSFQPNLQNNLAAQNNLGDINWFSKTTHKAKASVYSDHTNGKIPKCLILKPKGSKQVLFYKDRVLQWQELGCPSNFDEIFNLQISKVN